MPIELMYGVQSDELEEANSWVEAAVGLKGEGRYSDHLGGDYYKFETSAGDTIKLVTNRDVQDNEPFWEAAAEWLIVMSVNVGDQASPVMNALDKDHSKFEQLSKKIY